MASTAPATSDDLFAAPAAPSAEASTNAEEPALVGRIGPAAQRELARIMSSPSVGAAMERRVLSYLRHGHTIDDDRDRPLFDLPRKAGQYVVAALDLIGADKGGPAATTDQAERRARAMAKLATAAALILAAHDTLSWACAQDGETRST